MQEMGDKFWIYRCMIVFYWFKFWVSVRVCVSVRRCEFLFVTT
jgi:hypothetical protein